MENQKTFLRKRMDYLPAVFLQVDRISKFIREMNQYNVKDIKKLEKLIADLESDLKYHVNKKAKNELGELNKIKSEIEELDIFKDPEKYVMLLIEKKGELINLSGIVGLLPDYVSGMPTHER